MTPRARGWAAPFASLVLLASCTSGPEHRDAVRHHADGKGILSVRTDGGGGSWGMAPPRRGNDRWSGSFGLYLLCTTGGQTARLDDVTWTSSAEPLEVEVFVRRIPAREDRTAGKDYSPIGMLRGTPETQPEWGGTFVDYRGQEIAERCPEGRPDVDGPREELVIALTSGPEGAALDDFTVAYTANGRPYALDVAWSMALCGPAVTRGC